MTTQNTGKKVEKKNLFKKGHDPRRNINGRPKGSRNFSTIFKEVMEEIAENGGTDEEKELVREAIRQAKEGKYQYHKDIFDRVYGQAEQKASVQGEVNINIVKYGNTDNTA